MRVLYVCMCLCVCSRVCIDILFRELNEIRIFFLLDTIQIMFKGKNCSFNSFLRVSHVLIIGLPNAISSFHLIHHIFFSFFGEIRLQIRKFTNLVKGL